MWEIEGLKSSVLNLFSCIWVHEPCLPHYILSSMPNTHVHHDYSHIPWVFNTTCHGYTHRETHTLWIHTLPGLLKFLGKGKNSCPIMIPHFTDGPEGWSWNMWITIRIFIKSTTILTSTPGSSFNQESFLLSKILSLHLIPASLSQHLHLLLITYSTRTRIQAALQLLPK